MSNFENIPNRKEILNETDQSDFEISNKLEKSPGASQETRYENEKQRTEEARSEVLKMAIKIEAEGKKTEKESKPIASAKHSNITKKQKNESYKRTIKRVQTELPIHERTFSKIIHNKVIESTSNVVASTVARPNSILYGAFFAFIFTLATYFVAKTIGYQLSGSETIIAFSLGWIIGLLVDYLKALFNSKS